MSGFDVATDRDLLTSIRIRNDDNLMATSRLDRTGRHLDALIGLQLQVCKGRAVADEYRNLCAPWTDGFFERSLLRRIQSDCRS